MADTQASSFKEEIEWLKRVIDFQFFHSFNQRPPNKGSNVIQAKVVNDILPPELEGVDTYAKFLHESALSFDERLLLILALVNHIDPVFLPAIFYNQGQHSKVEQRRPTLQQNLLFGGMTGTNPNWFIPTGLTFLFVRGGKDYRERMEAQQVFAQSNVLSEKGVILLEPHLKGEPTLSGRLTVMESYIELFTLGYMINQELNSLKYPENRH